MEIRNAVHPEHAVTFNTDQMRAQFLIQELFKPDRIKLIYSYFDRLIVGGVCPIGSLMIDIDEKIIGAPYLLNRRELGLINIGGAGSVAIDGEEVALEFKDGLYIGMGARELVFSSSDQDNPAKFYLNCAPAHTRYPNATVAFKEAEPIEMGAAEQSYQRTIRKLVMGMTTLETGSVWNTMPVHTHQRRMEAYFYFGMPQDQVVFNIIGEPTETPQIVVSK